MSEIYTFHMPDIGEGVVEGEVVSWIKKVGDRLIKDEPVLVLMTDKATVELPTPFAGILSKTYYNPGDIAKKGLALFDVAIDGEVVPKESLKVLASPAVRARAAELGLSLKDIQGSGPEGRILEKDLQAPTPSPGQDTEIPLIGIKRLMAKKMEESHRHIPPFSYFEHADAARLVHLREKMLPEAREKGIDLTYMPFFLKALSETLKKHPIANSSVNEEKSVLIEHKRHNIGIAMKTAGGLIVPVLKGVEKMSLFEVIYAYQDLKNKSKNNTLASTDMKEATITITNFGALASGADYATPIINYPEVAILGLAHIHQEPVVQQGALAIGQILHCSWSFDHRVIDGASAADISRTFIRFIENPGSLFDSK